MYAFPRCNIYISGKSGVETGSYQQY